MTAKPAATLRAARRGDDVGELQLIDSEGRVAILFAHGIHDDERLRVCETALRLIRDALEGPDDPERPRPRGLA